MKNYHAAYIISSLILMVSASARADSVAFECGKNRAMGLDRAQISFSSDDVALKGNGFDLQINGRSVKNATAVFMEKNNRWLYVVTQNKPQNGHRYYQYIFDGPAGCQEDGDSGSVSIYNVGAGQGRELLQTLKCTCDAD